MYLFITLRLCKGRTRVSTSRSNKPNRQNFWVKKRRTQLHQTHSSRGSTTWWLLIDGQNTSPSGMLLLFSGAQLTIGWNLRRRWRTSPEIAEPWQLWGGCSRWNLPSTLMTSWNWMVWPISPWSQQKMFGTILVGSTLQTPLSWTRNTPTPSCHQSPSCKTRHTRFW